MNGSEAASADSHIQVNQKEDRSTGRIKTLMPASENSADTNRVRCGQGELPEPNRSTTIEQLELYYARRDFCGLAIRWKCVAFSANVTTSTDATEPEPGKRSSILYKRSMGPQIFSESRLRYRDYDANLETMFINSGDSFVVGGTLLGASGQSHKDLPDQPIRTQPAVNIGNTKFSALQGLRRTSDMPTAEWLMARKWPVLSSGDSLARRADFGVCKSCRISWNVIFR